MNNTPVYVPVLAGCRSRMGKGKALLEKTL